MKINLVIIKRMNNYKNNKLVLKINIDKFKIYINLKYYYFYNIS
jgi:hypothetical protein